MKIWVVGKKGLVGSDVCRYLGSKQINYLATDHQEVDVLDRTSIQRVLNEANITHIINCAAIVEVDGCESEKKNKAFQINVEGVETLAKESTQYGARLIHISTDFVFDGTKKQPYIETDPVHPLNTYGETKLEGEKRLFTQQKDAVCVRTSWLYGREKPGHVSSVWNALKEKESIPAFTDVESSPTNTEDLAKALVNACDIPAGIYHFANKGCVSRKGFAEEIFHLAKEHKISMRCQMIKGVLQSEVQRAATRPKMSALDPTKIETATKMSVRSWQEALKDHVERYCITQEAV